MQNTTRRKGSLKPRKTRDTIAVLEIQGTVQGKARQRSLILAQEIGSQNTTNKGVRAYIQTPLLNNTLLIPST